MNEENAHFYANTSRMHGVQSLITSSAYLHNQRFQPTLQDYKTRFMLSNDVVQGLANAANGVVTFMKATLVTTYIHLPNPQKMGRCPLSHTFNAY